MIVEDFFNEIAYVIFGQETMASGTNLHTTQPTKITNSKKVRQYYHHNLIRSYYHQCSLC